jgi:hypothetical protein
MPIATMAALLFRSAARNFLCREALEFGSISQCLRPPAVKFSEKDRATADIILEFCQILVGPDVRNHEVIGRDDVLAPLPGFDFLDRKLVFLGQLPDSFPI